MCCSVVQEKTTAMEEHHANQQQETEEGIINDEMQRQQQEELYQIYSDAYNENPSLLEFLSLIFLKYSKNNLQNASQRLGKYLEWRRNVFGNLNDQTLENNSLLQQQLQSSFLMILPFSINNKRILYVELKKHNTSLYSTNDTLKTWHYVIMSELKKNPLLAYHGFYVTGNLTNISYSNLDINIPHAIIHAVSGCMPIRINQFFIINPPYIAQFFLPIIKMLLSTKLSQRLNIIHDYSHLTEHYDIPPTYLPEAIGGTISENILTEIFQTILTENICV